jgi:hypothetical protein
LIIPETLDIFFDLEQIGIAGVPLHNFLKNVEVKPPTAV